MREKQATSKVVRIVPPPELRRFTDASRPRHDGLDLGVNVYTDRGAWLAARQAWADEHGMTLQEWWDDLMDEMRQDMHEGRCTLAEANDVFRFHVEPDDFRDPRTAA